MNKPECLHIPTLLEGRTAQINWGAQKDTNYILERVFNEPFSQAFSGYTWDNIDTLGESWYTYDQDALNWSQIETRTSKGRNWERLDYEQSDWTQIENRAQTWKQLESQEINFEIYRGPGSGRASFWEADTWQAFDALDQAWNSLELIGRSWDGTSPSSPGLSWDSLDAAWLTFHEWEEKGLTFDELDHRKHEEEHRGMTDVVPVGARNATYRIKATDRAGAESDYLTTLELPVIPVFYRSGTVEYPVQAGKRYVILLRAEEVIGFGQIPMNLCYNQYLLELTSLAADSRRNVTKPGVYPEEHVTIYSSVPGKVRFQSTRPSEPDECFSGAVTVAEFIARGTGTAAISLS